MGQRKNLFLPPLLPSGRLYIYAQNRITHPTTPPPPSPLFFSLLFCIDIHFHVWGNEIERGRGVGEGERGRVVVLKILLWRGGWWWGGGVDGVERGGGVRRVTRRTPQ